MSPIDIQHAITTDDCSAGPDNPSIGPNSRTKLPTIVTHSVFAQSDKSTLLQLIRTRDSPPVCRQNPTQGQSGSNLIAANIGEWVVM